MQIEIKLSDEYLEYYKDYNKMPLPEYATPGSAAVDLVALKDYVIYPGEVVEIHTGVSLWIGSADETDIGVAKENGWGLAAHIIPRSGRGAKEGLVIANTIGLIDEDYKSELIVYAFNRNAWGREIVTDGDGLLNKINIKAGERFAQLYFIPIIKPTFKIVEEFSDPEIVHSGFGSTGNG